MLLVFYLLRILYDLNLELTIISGQYVVIQWNSSFGTYVLKNIIIYSATFNFLFVWISIQDYI